MAVDDDGHKPGIERGRALGSLFRGQLIGFRIDDLNGEAFVAHKRGNQTRPHGILHGGEPRAERLINLRPAAGVYKNEIWIHFTGPLRPMVDFTM